MSVLKLTSPDGSEGSDRGMAASFHAANAPMGSANTSARPTLEAPRDKSQEGARQELTGTGAFSPVVSTPPDETDMLHST